MYMICLGAAEITFGSFPDLSEFLFRICWRTHLDRFPFRNNPSPAFGVLFFARSLQWALSCLSFRSYLGPTCLEYFNHIQKWFACFRNKADTLVSFFRTVSAWNTTVWKQVPTCPKLSMVRNNECSEQCGRKHSYEQRKKLEVQKHCRKKKTKLDHANDHPNLQKHWRTKLKNYQQPIATYKSLKKHY